MLIDTHAHLDFPEFEGRLDDVLQRAADAGVDRVITIGTSLASSRRNLEIAERYPQVYAAVGIHPGSAHQTDPHDLEDLYELVWHPKAVAIGETGLDYYRLPGGDADTAVKAAQALFFKAQLEIAAARGFNTIVHQRGLCMADTLAILEPFEDRIRAVFHCYSGTPLTADLLAGRRHLVSFTGIVTFKNGQQMQSCAASVGEGTYMVETDCPYLAPAPHRGSVCEPAHTRFTAEKIAQLRGKTLEQIAAATTSAAVEFFRLQLQGDL